MVISITTSHPDEDQRQRADRFLADFLPRLEREPGVVAVYHYSDTGDSTTLIVWRDDDARLAYRTTALAGEAMAFEQASGLPAVRRAFQLSYPPA